MKNQGYWITRIVGAALALAILAYMGYHIAAALDEPLQTVTAVRITAPNATPVEGVVVRSEFVVPLPPGYVAFTAEEGEHVAQGATLAVAYASQTDLERRLRIRELESQLDMLGYIKNRSGGVTDITRMDASIRDSLAGLIAAAGAGQPGKLSQGVLDLKTLLFQQTHSFEGEEVITPLMQSLESEIAALNAALGSASSVLRADDPGLFSAVTDGLESVWTPAAIGNLTAERFEELSAFAANQPSGDKGKLVKDWTWYFACLLPVKDAGVAGQNRRLRFEDETELIMRTVSVSEEQDGLCAVVFSSGRYLSDMLDKRELDAELVWGSYDGIRIPHNGLRIEEGQHFVYCLALGRIVRKNVTLVDSPDSDTYYLCNYAPSKSGALLPGDEIIVSGKGLYAGKVVD